MKETELKSHLLTLPPILHHLDDSERQDLEEKVNSLQDLSVRLKLQLETRIDLARSYVKFHSIAVDLSTELDSIEDDFKKTDNVPDERIRSTEEKWLSIQQLYIQLSHVGKNFIQDAGNVRIIALINFFFIMSITMLGKKNKNYGDFEIFSPMPVFKIAYFI